jgi:predicted 2-oxoglutarate/Fe(II)-dependent dioxygenase YbiX
LDGKPNREDGLPEEQEYSALLYFSSYGDDFTGGELEFPLQDLIIHPENGDLIIFRGNHLYPHRVSLVTMGMRDTMILFLGKKGNVSDRSITSYVD